MERKQSGTQVAGISECQYIWGENCRGSMAALLTIGSIPSSVVKAGFVCRAGH